MIARPCHECGIPRGPGYLNREKPGKVLCAKCAGVSDRSEMERRLFGTLIEAIAKDGLERHMALSQARGILHRMPNHAETD